MTQFTKDVGSVSAIRESTETLRSQNHVDVLTPQGLAEAMSEGALFRRYLSGMKEGMSADSAENFGTLVENFQTVMLRENSINGIQPVSHLTMPMLRKAWPKIGVKEAIPTEPVKVPKFTVSHLIPYVKDPATGAKLELPQALRDRQLSSSQKRIPTAPFAMPMDNVNVMPASAPVAAGHALDPVFSVASVTLEVTDAAGSNKESVTVKVYDGKAETRQGNIRFTVSGEHSSGHVTSATAFGYVDLQAGTLTLASMSAAATKDMAFIADVSLNGRIETTNNKNSTQIGFDIKTTEIHIGTGEHFDAALPLEWLQDNLALYNIDGTLKVVDIMTEVLAQNVDLEGADFIDECFDKITDQGAQFQRSFDVWPTGNYTGSPSEWLAEIRRVTDNLAQTMRNYSNFSGGTFMLVGNPIDLNLYTGVNWTFTADAGTGRDGVDVTTYSLGAMSGAQSYRLFSSQNLPAGKIWIFFVPSQDDIKTLMYYPYSFNVERSSAGFVSPNTPNNPSVMLTKRHVFQEFVPLVGSVTILNNNGTLPA